MDKRPIVGDVRNPLGFFVVALSVIEAAMCVGIAAARLTPALAFAALCVMAGLFLVVVAAVTYITVRLPHHLYEQIGRDLKAAKQMAEFTNSRGFREAVLEIVAEPATGGAAPDTIPGADGPEP